MWYKREPVDPLLYKKLIQQQREMSEQVVLQPLSLSSINYLAGCDSALIDDKIFSIFVIFKFPELEVVEIAAAHSVLEIPYIPGLLSFRESPNLLKAYAKLKIMPDVIMVDGHGIAHPRRMGIAAHLGVLLDVPTIGVAKSKLVGDYLEPAAEQGSVSELTYHGNKIGDVLRTKSKVKPVYVSPGHLADFDAALNLTIQTGRGYRLPEPTRIADKYSKEQKVAFDLADTSIQTRMTL